jgi:hypothetical protein
MKITERPVFEFEKQEYLQKLKPVRDTGGLVAYYGGWYLLLPMFVGGALSGLLRAVLRLPEDAAMLTGLALALAGSIYASIKVKRSQRAFYEQERARLDRSVIETLDVEVRRAWTLDDCSCCSMSYLLQASDEELVFLETSGRADAELDGFPARRMKIEREHETKAIWRLRNEGPPVSLEPLDFMMDDLFPESSTECEVLKINELPEALKAKLAAS